MLELTPAQYMQTTQDSNTVTQLACPAAQLPTHRPNQPTAQTSTQSTVDVYIRLHIQATNTPLSIVFEMLAQRMTDQLFELAQKDFDIFTLNTATCMPVYYQHTLIGTASIKVPGEPLEDYGSSTLTDQLARSLAIIQAAAILTGDPDPDGNILWNASTQTLTRIDFERAYLLDRSEPNIPNASYPKGIKADVHFSFAPWIHTAQYQEPTSNLSHMLCLPWQTPQRIYSLLTDYLRTMKTCLLGAPCRTLLRQAIESIRIHPLLNIDDTALSHAKTILQKRTRYIKISDLDATLADPHTAERLFTQRVSPCPRYAAVCQALKSSLLSRETGVLSQETSVLKSTDLLPASPPTSPLRPKQRSSKKHHEALENFRLDGEAGATLP